MKLWFKEEKGEISIVFAVCFRPWLFVGWSAGLQLAYGHISAKPGFRMSVSPEQTQGTLLVQIWIKGCIQKPVEFILTANRGQHMTRVSGNCR